MSTEDLFDEMMQDVKVRVDMPYDFGKETLDAILKFLRGKGYVKLPAEWYLAEDGDGDVAIWQPLPEAHRHHDWDECIGIRFMAGNARIEKPVADWLWENVRKGES